MIVRDSRFSYRDTVDKLSAAITAAGNTLFASIDQAKAAEAAGTALRPTTLLAFGNPKAGTPLMDRFPEMSLELPLKIAAWDDNGRVCVAYEAIRDVAGRRGVTGFDELLQKIDRAVDAIAAAVAK